MTLKIPRHKFQRFWEWVTSLTTQASDWTPYPPRNPLFLDGTDFHHWFSGSACFHFRQEFKTFPQIFSLIKIIGAVVHIRCTWKNVIPPRSTNTTFKINGTIIFHQEHILEFFPTFATTHTISCILGIGTAHTKNQRAAAKYDVGVPPKEADFFIRKVLWQFYILAEVATRLQDDGSLRWNMVACKTTMTKTYGPTRAWTADLTVISRTL